MLSIPFVLAGLALVVPQAAYAQGPNASDIPEKCLSVCAPFTNRQSLCTLGFDNSATRMACLCKDEYLQDLAKCLVCESDPNVPLPHGTTKRPTLPNIQKLTDVLVDVCHGLGLHVHDIDIKDYSSASGPAPPIKGDDGNNQTPLKPTTPPTTTTSTSSSSSSSASASSTSTAQPKGTPATTSSAQPKVTPAVNAGSGCDSWDDVDNVPAKPPVKASKTGSAQPAAATTAPPATKNTVADWDEDGAPPVKPSKTASAQPAAATTAPPATKNAAAAADWDEDGAPPVKPSKTASASTSATKPTQTPNAGGELQKPTDGESKPATAGSSLADIISANQDALDDLDGGALLDGEDKNSGNKKKTSGAAARRVSFQYAPYALAAAAMIALSL